MKLDEKTVVVTGGGSGIGRELVLALLAKGARVAAVDLRQEGLNETAALARAGDRLSLHIADISDRDAVLALPAAIAARHGAVDGLINNAGIIQPFVHFSELDFAAIDRMVAINLMGTINMTKAFLPALKARPEAHLANVASMGGFMPFPGQSMYGAAKAGVKLLTEALYAELAETKVGVSVVMPGAIRTQIMANSGIGDRAMAESPEAASRTLPAPEAARIILAGIEANRLHILVGKDANMLFKLWRLMPEKSIRFIQKQMARR
ncbi:SDR family NAD(P)-dependent oxidoreductase [Devosia sediminis]|uniref:SDR family oxidoreductase n=1 Tax=Devosia sediminis TaxID=2798801 RepID=A0A934J1A0_9HYPH|nr:SDR family oxidoreductase [Devosia sediminis]MBJ3785997.1 SDR family oxidoreductase [Devosia sediminis]